MSEVNISDYYYSRTKRPFFRFAIKPLPSDKPKINIFLFFLTIMTTWIVWGPWYSIPVVIILLSHEMGHYLMCKRYGVPATLPFFLPLPLPPFGTLGAMIQMKGIIPHRRALFDIGAAGPIAGLLVSIPFTLWGIAQSDILLVNDISSTSTNLGDSLLFKLLSYMAVGNLAENYTLLLHPMAYAGWVGLFVTSLNLLPIGQLDGGHIFYSVFGKHGFKFMNFFIIAIGILCVLYPGWLVLFILLLLFGRRHPAPYDDYTRLDKKRQIIAFILFIIFVTTFLPIPLYL